MFQVDTWFHITGDIDFLNLIFNECYQYTNYLRRHQFINTDINGYSNLKRIIPQFAIYFFQNISFININHLQKLNWLSIMVKLFVKVLYSFLLKLLENKICSWKTMPTVGPSGVTGCQQKDLYQRKIPPNQKPVKFKLCLFF